MSDKPGRLVGVGVGPGDPELMTALAVRVVSEADRVVAPTTGADSPGRAETIVRRAVPGASVQRLALDMGGGATVYDEAARALVAWVADGESVCFVTLGDPNIYSTFSALVAAARRLSPGIRVETVPGIMAFQALAARAGTVLSQGTESLALVTALDGVDDLKRALSDPNSAVVVYKGGRHMPAICSALDAHGRLDGAVMGELLGLEGERAGPLSELGAEEAGYLVTAIVPAAGRQRT